ncbi:MAG: hypothetical protein ABIF84_01730 [Patescibacteria group bacterium]
MPDPYREPTEEKPEISSSVSANPAEQEILELERKLAAKKAVLGTEKEKPLEQIIGQEKQVSSLAALQSSSTPAVAALGVQVKEKAGELKRYEKTQQLKGLIDLAFQKGISYALDVVKEMDNPFLMDELHDVLIDELHKELVERGKLEEI